MKYGLIGKTLVHSYSKEIHEALGKYSYGLFSLAPEEVSNFINGRDFAGLNVTIPYKQDVIFMCDEVSELASSIGSVNTLYWKSDASAIKDSPDNSRGLLVGHNTDYEGFLYTAKRSDIDFAGKTVLILGTGGTSLTARKAAADQGANKIYVVSRHLQTGEQADVNVDSSASVTHLTYDNLPSIAGEIEIIINTTPVGTYPNNLESIVDLAAFLNCEAVIDVIYNPFKTKLILDAEKAGIKTANGLPMLVAQATAAAGYFLGTPGAFESENERIIDKLIRQMRNIVLIGMPGSGKSTIGKILAEKTSMTFVDMDDEIIKNTGKSIPQIFEENGEAGFRDIESEVAKDLGKEHGLVIATGGGAILRPENIDALKQNALVVYIKRPVDTLSTNGRPLSKDLETLRRMEKVRTPIYEAAADIIYDNQKDEPCHKLFMAVLEKTLIAML